MIMKNIKKLTKTFSIKGEYYTDIKDYLEKLDPKEFHEIDNIECINCESRKVINLNPETLYNILYDHFQYNHSEDGSEWNQISKTFEEEFVQEFITKLNDKSPSLWFETKDKVVIPKSEILDYTQKALNKSFDISPISQQRELLIDFAIHFDGGNTRTNRQAYEQEVDDYLKSINCG